MSRRSYETWPPLIVASEKPRWVWWRDFALTLLMWLVFAIMLETEFELFFGRYLERLGLGDFDTNANWARFFERMEAVRLSHHRPAGLPGRGGRGHTSTAAAARSCWRRRRHCRPPSRQGAPGWTRPT